jgi:hypothetical protein
MMSDEAIKDRMGYAKESAMQDYRDRHYIVIPSDNGIICFSAVHTSGNHEIKVRVTIDKITELDRTLVFGLRVPPNQCKEIMCKIYDTRKWIRELYDHLNNLCQ